MGYVVNRGAESHHQSEIQTTSRIKWDGLNDNCYVMIMMIQYQDFKAPY